MVAMPALLSDPSPSSLPKARTVAHVSCGCYYGLVVVTMFALENEILNVFL